MCVWYNIVGYRSRLRYLPDDDELFVGLQSGADVARVA